MEAAGRGAQEVGAVGRALLRRGWAAADEAAEADARWLLLLVVAGKRRGRQRGGEAVAALLDVPGVVWLLGVVCVFEREA